VTDVRRTETKHLSVTFTALIWTGLIVVLAGVAMTAFGSLDTGATIEVSWGKARLKTVHVGLALVIVGALLAGIVSLRLPKNVRVFAGHMGRTERLASRIGGPSLVGAIIATVVLILMLIKG
jgi:uncharacterized membrane protein YidH (DUF202 family)